MASMYLVTAQGYEKLLFLIDPLATAGWSLSEKVLHSTKMVASILTIVVCINLPRFWLPNSITDANDWLSYVYAPFLDAFVPLIVLVVFGMCIWKKVNSNIAN